MKTFTYSPSEGTTVVSQKNERYVTGLRFMMIKHLITVILSVVLLMLVVPADASTGSANERKSTCRAKQISYSYIVVAKKKNNPMVYTSKKHSKRSKVRNYSFPL